MNGPLPSTRRLIVVAILAAAILLALVIAMGGVTISGPGAVGPVTTLPTTSAHSGSPAPKVAGIVTVKARHLHGHTWEFIYTLRDTGNTPLGGFQLNAVKANLFQIKGGGWNFFGSGVCGQNHPGILIYWSTTDAPIKPEHHKRFSFQVNTRGAATMQYAISYGTDVPQFGSTRGPINSSLPATGKCP